jgi:threonine dehydrogenase-like Zn-dependent dehydrogenase
MQGRLAVLTAYGKPFELREYPVPDPEPGGMVLRIREAGICGSDLHTWRGDQTAPPPPRGRAMGHEGVGVVAKLGSGVDSDALGAPLREGDRVIHSAIFPCMRCHLCLRGDVNFCTKRSAWREAGDFPYFIGTYADYFYLPARHPVFKVPDELPDAALSFVNCALGTVTQGLNSAGVRHGQSVVIQGAGGLGLSAAAVAREMGAGQIIALDRLANRLELAKRFGADETINITEYETPQARVERVRELTQGRGADLVMELVGIPSLLAEGFQMLGEGGTFLEIGNIIVDSRVEFAPYPLLRGRKIMGSAMYRPAVLPQVLDFLLRTRDRFPFASLVSHRFPLAQINEAFPIAEWNNTQTDVIRAVLVP